MFDADCAKVGFISFHFHVSGFHKIERLIFFILRLVEWVRIEPGTNSKHSTNKVHNILP